VVNDLGVDLIEETLNQLEIEGVMIAEMGHLSLNALTGTEEGDSMRLLALVQDKVMLILVDSCSSHSFVSKSFIDLLGITPSVIDGLLVRVANGELLNSSGQVSELEWWAQGFTFHTTMRVLDIAAYDAILGYDWLKAHNPMVCHWELKTIEFIERGQQVHLQGVQSKKLAISKM
jgi:hypothetical protein